jgi:copper oxidase (laccase) domain-containing protein
MSFKSDSRERVAQNRTTFINNCGILTSTYIPVHCDHGETVLAVTDTDAVEVGNAAGIHAEAVATQTKNLPLFLLTADCQPMSFFDPVTETIALAHVSRVTLGKKLPEKVVWFLQNTFGAKPEDLLVYIGPHIRKESYAFPLPLLTIDPLLAPHIYEENEQAHIDLLGASTELLTQSGVKLENISVSEVNTATSNNHFSYYRAKNDNSDTTARIATVLMIKHYA